MIMVTVESYTRFPHLQAHQRVLLLLHKCLHLQHCCFCCHHALVHGFQVHASAARNRPKCAQVLHLTHLSRQGMNQLAKGGMAGRGHRLNGLGLHDRRAANGGFVAGGDGW